MNAREEVGRRETVEKGVQALVGIQYLPPPPIKEIHIEQTVYQGPYYVAEGGGGDCVHMYANCWGLRNTRARAKQLCRCCNENEGRSLKG